MEDEDTFVLLEDDWPKESGGEWAKPFNIFEQLEDSEDEEFTMCAP